MSTHNDRRSEVRIRFSWPLWFAFDNHPTMHRAQILDMNQHAVSFLCDGNTPVPGQHVNTRFSYPQVGNEGFEMGSYWHWGQIQRVKELHGGRKHVVMTLDAPLETHPAGSHAEPVMALA